MGEWLAGLIVVGGLTAGVVYALDKARTRRMALERLHHGAVAVVQPAALDAPLPIVRRFARRHYLLPWVAAIVVGLSLHYLIGLPPLFAAALGGLVGLLGTQLDALRLSRREDKIETQLADAVDLMVAAVKVGTSLPQSLESVLRDAKLPLRAPLEEVVGRIRLGDAVVEVLHTFTVCVPLETFRLFAVTLAVNWDTGGKLAQTLSSVGRTIRDRMELTRRLRALTTQARASIVSIVGVTYFIAALMWRNDPLRMEGFLASTVGQAIVATAIVLQGIGMLWISSLSKPRF